MMIRESPPFHLVRLSPAGLLSCVGAVTLVAGFSAPDLALAIVAAGVVGSFAVGLALLAATPARPPRIARSVLEQQVTVFAKLFARSFLFGLTVVVGIVATLDIQNHLEAHPDDLAYIFTYGSQPVLLAFALLSMALACVLTVQLWRIGPTGRREAAQRVVVFTSRRRPGRTSAPGERESWFTGLLAILSEPWWFAFCALISVLIAFSTPPLILG